jgi:transposase
VPVTRRIDADYETQWLFPPSLEDLVPEDHPARFIRAFVDSLDLESLGFQVEPAATGRPGYAPGLLLKICMYSFLNRIRSLREMEKACREHLSLLWLTGGHQPDHNALWRFWRDHREALRAVSQEVVKVAWRSELVGVVLHAVDGTKLRAAGSTTKVVGPEQIERLLRQAEVSFGQMDGELAASAQEDLFGGYRLPEELTDRDRLRERIERAREADGQSRPRHPGEPEAALMRCEGGRIELAYNAQAVVDADSGLVVSHEVTTEASDNHQLVPRLDQVREELGRVADDTVADGGYASGRGLAEAEAKQFSVTVRLPEEVQKRDDHPYGAAHFSYDRQRDVCICPRGEELSFIRERIKPDRGYAVREYRCGSFRSCPVRELCSKDRQGRRIEIAPHHEALVRQRERQNDPGGRQRLARRKVIVEPVFARAKHLLGYRRLTRWGLDGARTEWALICAVLNLQKLMANWRQGQLTLS